MKKETYYVKTRKQNRKHRKKLIRTLRKNLYSDAEILRIVDAMSGDTPYGKELTAKEIVRLLLNGAAREEIEEYVERLNRKSFFHPSGE